MTAGICECGRQIDGSRALAARHFERCSRCRREARLDAQDRVRMAHERRQAALPDHVSIAIRQHAFREVIGKMSELEQVDWVKDAPLKASHGSAAASWRALREWLDLLAR